MNKKTEEFFEKLQEIFPATKRDYIESIEEYGEILETVVIEDVFMPPILTLLKENTNFQLLNNLFEYFEEIVNGDDLHLINIFSITVLECLGNDKMLLEVAKTYMGTKTTLLQIEVDKGLGRIQNYDKI